MKFNWGTGIFIVIVLFLIAVIAFFIFINNLDVNLVEENYYERELAYQERIDRINNTSSLAGKIVLIQEPGVIIIQFPPSDSIISSKGNLTFYRPSDPKKDLKVPLNLNDSSRQIVDITGMDKGKWVVKIDWDMGGKEYYFEESVIIAH